jgi:hypothetical protein
MASLALTYFDLLRALGRDLGWGRNPGKWEEDDKQDAADAIKTGLQSFYVPLPLDGQSHRWSFMDPLQTLTTVAPYSTGTVTVVNGVVTLAGGTFPSWAASGDLSVDGVSYTVNTRDSGTQVTLDDLTVDADALSTYELSQQIYDLPTDFGGLHGDISYRRGQSNFRTTLRNRSDELVRRIFGETLASPGAPSYYATRPKTFSGGASSQQRWEIVFDCPTDAAYTFDYRYSIQPDAIDPTNVYPYGGAQHAETLKEAVLAAGELMLKDDANGPHRQRFLELLKSSIEKDRAEFTPDSLGVDVGDPVCGTARIAGRTTFAGEPIP